MRWMMCPKCGVKMSLIQEDKEILIHMCPIHKDWYMTFYGGLLKRLEEISRQTGKSIQELIIEATERLKERI